MIERDQRDRERDSGSGNARHMTGRRSFDRPVFQKTARDAVLMAVTDVLRRGAYSSQALDRALSAVQLKDEDRRLAAGLFAFTVENCVRIDWYLAKLMETEPIPAVQDILRLAAAQLLFMDRIPDHAAVDEAVKQAKRGGYAGMSGLVNGVLHALIRMRDEGTAHLPDPAVSPDEYISVVCSVSMPIARRMLEAYGLEDACAMLKVKGGAMATCVRPNRMRADAGTLGTMLSKEGIEWTAGHIPDALLVRGGGRLSSLKGFGKGLFSIQSESSMLAAMAVEAKPGMQILDACAAPGGKTCFMAERMGGAGRIYAWDIHDHRVELIRAAARRLWLENIRPSVHDASVPSGALEMGMDAVLADVPCSGLGVMSEKPDIRFRISEDELRSLPGTQERILDSCAVMVRPGGLLVYTTCTLLPEENERLIERFLSKHPEFEMDLSLDWLPVHLRDRAEGGRLLIRPDLDDMDGFFIARMRRRRV